ncbi:MAG: aminodeoxychorismate synthase, component I [Gammaproteobacteria bacterium RIFCSPHIGHO2_12_FULL_63_22]|nr:MAG: aminodeoxychorismate synthase, component I [Gammaproteobacteria bacterium RIFCSPHIGHO2_12_FULL_63_22]
MTSQRELSPGLDLLALHRLDPVRYPLLLESVAGGNALSRWDLLLVADGSGLRLEADGITRRLDGEVLAGRFLDCLDAGWQELQAVPDNAAGPVHASQASAESIELPFRGGWGLFLAYELAAQVETVLRLPPAPGPLPVALALRCPAVVARDRSNGVCIGLCEAGREALLETIARDISRMPATSLSEPWQAPAAIIEDEPKRFLDGVAKVHDYLRDGDVFQVNLSRAWNAVFNTPPRPDALYARLREANPAPFAGLLVQPGWALASSSPERLVSVRGDNVQTRPIAGTRPRIAGDDEQLRIQELVGHPKERAEHVMLIDLERNDLGRVCQAGSVEVDELMIVESYTHVHHIVSNVRGRLREDVTPGQVIAAVFPGGTITGCPKVRCMQIIAELEGEGRGPYTGAMGYLNRDGDMDLNILIRSAWLAGTQLQLRAGAGLVVDSIAEAELDETRAKARGLMRALDPA